MRKVVINSCFGGFSLSPEAVLDLYRGGMAELATPVYEYWKPGNGAFERDGEYGLGASLAKWREYLKTGGRPSLMLHVFSDDEKFVLSSYRDIKRDDPRLIDVVERLGARANGKCADLKIVEIPDDVEWIIDEYDGNEHVAERHMTWS